MAWRSFCRNKSYCLLYANRLGYQAEWTVTSLDSDGREYYAEVCNIVGQ